MNKDDHLKPIPASFHSFHEDGPFTKCIECERNLLEDGCEYLIEKAVRNYPDFGTQDVIFDYAICMECAIRMNQELSKESMQAIRQYFNNNVDFQRNQERVNRASGDINQLTSHCMIKGTQNNDSNEYQLYAYCVGDKINLKQPPYMISGEALDEIADLISDKTRDSLNGFFDKHFSPDPSLMQPIPDRPRLVLI